MDRFVTRTRSLNFDLKLPVVERTIETEPLRHNPRRGLRSTRRLNFVGDMKKEFKHVGLKHRCCVDPVTVGAVVGAIGAGASLACAWYARKQHLSDKRQSSNKNNSSTQLTFDEWKIQKIEAKCQYFINSPTDIKFVTCNHKIRHCCISHRKNKFSLKLICHNNHSRSLDIPTIYYATIRGFAVKVV